MKLLLYFILSLLTLDCFSQWQPVVRLTNNSANSILSINNAWCIAASGNIVNVVWEDNRDGNYEIYNKRSTDGGISWGADIRLTNNSAFSGYPSITVTGTDVHVVWEDIRAGGFNYEIYYKRSTDGGLTWGTDTRLSNNTGESWYPSVTVSGSVVHVAWQDFRDGNDEIYYKHSTNGGTTWGADIRLTNNSASSIFPSVAVSGSDVYIVWEDDRNDSVEIYYKRSTDGGASWSIDTRLTNNIALSGYPSISVAGAVVHVVWADFRDGHGEIYYKCSTDKGISWGAETRLTYNNAHSQNPSIASSGQVVNVVWYYNGPEIHYIRSSDGGLTWGQDKRLDNNSPPAGAYNPSIAVSGTVVHVVWYDDHLGNLEIYYKRDPTGNVLPVTMAYFNSVVRANIVSLSWGTSWEINNSGFDVERKKASNNWENVGFVTGNGTTNEPKDYLFEDKNLNKGRYQYRLKQIDYNGNYEYFSLNNDAIISSPRKFEVSQNYPNPSNPKTKIDFQLPVDGEVSLKVYDLLGREVVVLVNETLKADFHTVEFDGSNLASGIYIYRLESEGFTQTKKMVLIK